MDEELRQKLYNKARRKVERLWYACFEGSLELVEELLDEGLYDVNGLNYWQTEIDPQGWKRAPIHGAILGQHFEIVEYLIEEGAKINIQTKSLDTPLFLAVGTQNVNIIKLLLDKNANKDIKNDENMSPLDYAIKLDNKEINDLLSN